LPQRRSKGAAKSPLILAAFAGAGLVAAGQAFAQADSASRSDTLPVARYRLDELTVVAHRRPTLIRESAIATSVVSRRMIERLPVRTLADALGYVPGLVFLERDGSGQLPMAVARGFFGGGETDYVHLIIDGVPANDVRTGTVQWTQVPLASVERIEVVRGGASTMYGDAAMGAVVSVITRDSADATRLRARVGVGAWGDRLIDAAAGGAVGSGVLDAQSSWRRLDGFREHASSEDISFNGSYRSGENAALGLYARTFARRLTRDEPGPLTADEAGRDPRQNNPLYDSDHRQLSILDLAAGLVRDQASEGGLRCDAALRVVDDEDTRTLLLTPNLGDTQLRDERNWNLWTRLQHDVSLGATSVVTGAELEYGEYETEYFTPDELTVPLTQGAGGRLELGLYAEGRQSLAERWNGFAGLRLDVLHVAQDGADSAEAGYSALSPRIGANFEYSLPADRAGHVYAAVTRSFKAPTLDQLYDVRTIPAGEDAFNISNPDLQPQTSTGIEVGFYQRLPLWVGAAAELDLGLYRLKVDDEIDFDLATFKYGNIQESRHDGFELSLSATLSKWLALQHSSNFMRVVFRSGELEGNRLKNIPRSALVTAIILSPARAVRLTMTHRYAGSLYFDDENTHEIPGYHTFGAQADWDLGPAVVFLSANNVFDTRASSLGFLSFDPATGAQVPFVYPIGGRAVRVGISASGSWPGRAGR
jgi:outer membrane receptor protein involved in Fe transport